MSSDTKSPDDSARKGPAPAPKKAAPKKAGAGGDSRQERLAQALRDNLRKRKAQQRQRQEGGA